MPVSQDTIFPLQHLLQNILYLHFCEEIPNLESSNLDPDIFIFLEQK